MDPETGEIRQFPEDETPKGWDSLPHGPNPNCKNPACHGRGYIGQIRGGPKAGWAKMCPKCYPGIGPRPGPPKPLGQELDEQAIKARASGTRKERTAAEAAELADLRDDVLKSLGKIERKPGDVVRLSVETLKGYGLSELPNRATILHFRPDKVYPYIVRHTDSGISIQCSEEEFLT